MALFAVSRFYFAMQASKSHEYPIAVMDALPIGDHVRTMLLCKVARGRIFQTSTNIDGLTGNAPDGYDSVHGLASKTGSMNYDEVSLLFF